MSISPPSDIVLDVARAADPARYAEAAARLTRTAADAAEPFAAILAGPAQPPPARAIAASLQPTPAPTSRAADAYQDFEAMVLATFIEATMPEQLSAVFGSGTAGSVWKSMLAEQLGAEMARAGGVGLARALAQDAEARAAAETLLVTAIERRAIDTVSQAETIDRAAASDHPR